MPNQHIRIILKDHVTLKTKNLTNSNFLNGIVHILYIYFLFILNWFTIFQKFLFIVTSCEAAASLTLRFLSTAEKEVIPF